jgi:diaminohydroxyphosphoribosylaminopyrimidine deaminase / 5-amino-6-(5-phosphoribosylamino)uracil reductase
MLPEAEKIPIPGTDPKHALFMERCLQLAVLGAGYTAPNPLVGAVLVYKDKIIGEGYHELYGQAHAEVNCLASVDENDRHLISESILYVSLEPCAHTGKTPPCADLIIREKIPVVVIGCRDPFPQVDGKGIEKLKSHGVKLIYPVLEDKCMTMNRRFMLFHLEKRPYIILKWAQSANGKTGSPDGHRLFISNEYSNKLVHKWRSEEAAIMVGSNTAIADNPHLTTRLWKGKNPIRVVLDGKNKLNSTSHLFDGESPTIILNYEKNGGADHVRYIKINKHTEIVKEILHVLYEEEITSVIVEGGTKLLNLFFESGMWDEARVITNNYLQIDNGQPAPEIRDSTFIRKDEFSSDSITYFKNQKSVS